MHVPSVIGWLNVSCVRPSTLLATLTLIKLTADQLASDIFKLSQQFDNIDLLFVEKQQLLPGYSNPFRK